MNEVVGLIGVIAWSENRWRGFDLEGYENRMKYGFVYVKEAGYGHEWWNFYDGFDDNYYIGHIETKGKPITKFQKGPIIFISRNVYNGKWYFVGFYGKGECDPNGFETGVKIKDLLPAQVVKNLEEKLAEIGSEDVKNYVSGVLNGEKTYKGNIRGNKENSIVFAPECYVEITPEDVGVKQFGQMSFTYIDQNKIIKVRNLLVKAKQIHEETLKQPNISEERKKEIKDIIEKIDFVLEYYFEGGTVNKEKLKPALQAGKEEYGEYWNRNSEKVLKVYREFLERVDTGEDPRKIYVELKNKYREVLDSYRDIDKLFWFIFGVAGPESLDDVSIEKFREFIKAMEDAKTEDDAWEVFENYKDAIKGIRSISLSTWASIIHPKWFGPLWWDYNRGIINRYNASLLGIDHLITETNGAPTIPLKKFYEIYPNLVKTIKEATEEVGVDNMLEAAFYLSKCQIADNLKTSKARRFWLIAPGEGAEYWDVCIDNEIICVGWREAAEDLKEKLLEIQDKEIFKEEMAKFYSSPQDYNQLWKFLKDVSNGDIVLAKKGAQKIIGIGIVKSEPKIDLKLDYPIYRRVKWYKTNLDMSSPKYFAGTITEITNKEIEKIPELKKIIEEVVEVIDKESDTGNVLENSEVFNLLKDKKQIILYGPPGTGKTWLARKFIKSETGDDKEYYGFVTFHPSYSYEEFVEGLKPAPAENGVKFVVEDGIFKRMAIKATCEILKNQNDCPEISKIANDLMEKLEEIERGVTENSIFEECNKLKRELWTNLNSLSEEDFKELFRNPDQAPKLYLIIDEINRGDISKIFGELITLLEADKRLGGENQIIATLPYSKELFGVPPNLYIIGTMNTADRSIALIDVALRRRFGFIEMMPSYEVLINELGIGKVESEEQAIEKIMNWNEDEIREDVKKLAIKALYVLNQKIQLIYDRDHQIGHSYLLKLKDGKVETLRHIWYHEIIPLLQEYFYNDWERLKYLLGDFVDAKELKEFADSELVDSDDAKIYTIKELSDKEFIETMLSITNVESPRSAEQK